MSAQKQLLKDMALLINKVIITNRQLADKRAQAMKIEDETKKADFYCSEIKGIMENYKGTLR